MLLLGSTVTFPDPSKRVIAVLGAVLLLGAGGAAVAQTQTDDRAAERQAFLDDVAERLGVTSDELEKAFKDARLARIDAALADGKITQEEADRMKQGIESGKGPFFLPGPGPAAPASTARTTAGADPAAGCSTTSRRRSSAPRPTTSA